MYTGHGNSADTMNERDRAGRPGGVLAVVVVAVVVVVVVAAAAASDGHCR